MHEDCLEQIQNSEDSDQIKQEQVESSKAYIDKMTKKQAKRLAWEDDHLTYVERMSDLSTYMSEYRELLC